MSPLKMILAAASIAALSGAAALADPAPDAAAPLHAWHKPSPDQMAAWHVQMCKDRYAHEAGRLAYLEAALSITPAQHGAFDQWRDAKLAAAKSHSETCLARTPGQGEKKHDALERNARMQKMLETKLAELKSERPALESLYASLTPDQKAIFDRAGGRFGHRHGHHMGERFGQGHDGWQSRAPG